MKQLVVVVVALGFAVALGACNKGDAPAAPGAEPKKGEPAAAAPAAEPRKEEPAPAAEPKKEEPAPAAAADMSGWPEGCKKAAACAAAWAKSGTGYGKDVVTEGWGAMATAIAQAPAEWETGCATALQSWGVLEGAPAECK